MGLKTNHKTGTFSDLTIHLNISAHTGNVIMNKVETNSFTVCMVMKLLVFAKYFILDQLHIKAASIIGNT